MSQVNVTMQCTHAGVVSRDECPYCDEPGEAWTKQFEIAKHALESAQSEMDAKVAAERERCAKIAIEAKRNHSRSGPVFVNGWNQASDYIEAKIRSGE